MVPACIQLGFISLGSMLLCGAGFGGNPEAGRWQRMRKMNQLLLHHGPFFWKRSLQFISGGIVPQDFSSPCTPKPTLHIYRLI